MSGGAPSGQNPVVLLIVFIRGWSLGGATKICPLGDATKHWPLGGATNRFRISFLYYSQIVLKYMTIV